MELLANTSSGSEFHTVIVFEKKRVLERVCMAVRLLKLVAVAVSSKSGGCSGCYTRV